MTPLRQRIIEDMQVRNLAPHTQRAYLQYVAQFACYFRKSPDLLGLADIRAFLLYLTRGRRLAPSSVGVAVAAIRFLYKVTLQRGWNVDDVVPTSRRTQTLPVVMSPEEVSEFLDAVGSLKHRVILTACYAAGLRISEAVHLTPTAIDTARSARVWHAPSGSKHARPNCCQFRTSTSCSPCLRRLRSSRSTDSTSRRSAAGICGKSTSGRSTSTDTAATSSSSSVPRASTCCTTDWGVVAC